MELSDKQIAKTFIYGPYLSLSLFRLTGFPRFYDISVYFPRFPFDIIIIVEVRMKVTMYNYETINKIINVLLQICFRFFLIFETFFKGAPYVSG